ncbi:MAG: SAM-dependent methyltransferase, partial [Bacteroidales bacterium]|nr:SAM-dependent methyltransferase [Bacteroidales bacterium]
HNFTVLDAGNITVHEGDGIAWLQNQTERFDLVYLDPARRDKTAGRVYDIAACEPNLLEIKDLLLKKAGRVLAKISPMADISRTLEQLPETREVHVVAVGGEVKELLLLLEPSQSGQPLPEPQIIAADGALRFAFAPAEEAAATVRYADRIGRYLYQPSKALRKAGAFRLLSQRFGLAKLAPATQLYTSDGIVEGFPGKRFEVEAVLDWGRAAIEELKRRYDRLEMTALNFPLDTEALRRRIGIPGGGDRHIFATTLSDKRKILLICKI